MKETIPGVVTLSRTFFSGWQGRLEFAPFQGVCLIVNGGILRPPPAASALIHQFPARLSALLEEVIAPLLEDQLADALDEAEDEQRTLLSSLATSADGGTALRLCQLQQIVIPVESCPPGTMELFFNVPWEPEHGSSFQVRNWVLWYPPASA